MLFFFFYLEVIFKWIKNNLKNSQIDGFVSFATIKRTRNKQQNHIKVLPFRNKMHAISKKVEKHNRLSFIDKGGQLVSSRMDSKWISHFTKIATKSEHKSNQR